METLLIIFAEYIDVTLYCSKKLDRKTKVFRFEMCAHRIIDGKIDEQFAKKKCSLITRAIQ